jgi:hypothetical protein
MRDQKGSSRWSGVMLRSIIAGAFVISEASAAGPVTHHVNTAGREDHG